MRDLGKVREVSYDVVFGDKTESANICHSFCLHNAKVGEQVLEVKFPKLRRPFSSARCFVSHANTASAFYGTNDEGKPTPGFLTRMIPKRRACLQIVGT